MRVLFLIPASYFMRILLGGDICFMGYIGSLGYVGLSITLFLVCWAHITHVTYLTHSSHQPYRITVHGQIIE